MAQPYRLPPRGATGAPSFEPDQPETLLDFFEDLEYMLEQADVTEDQKRKDHAVRYAPTTQKSLWRSFAAYAADKTYEEFKKEVVKEYLGEDGKRLYSLGDLKALIKLHTSKGFQSSSELKVYSRSFRVIADYLVKHEVLRNDDRDRYFIKGLPDALQVPVLERLRYKCPDVLAPRVPYTVAQVTEAAEFILDAQDEDAPLIAAPQRVVQPAPAPMQQVKTESTDLADALKAMAQAVTLLHQQRTVQPAPFMGGAPVRQGPPHLDPTAPRLAQCHYCGGGDHIIRRCPQVDMDTAAGLVKRNEQGQVVLASGHYVPGVIAGATLRERVQEFYRQNPAPQAAPQLLFEPIELAITRSDTTPTVQFMSAADFRRPATPSRGLIHDLEHHEGLFAQLEHEIYATDRYRARQKDTRAERADRRAARHDDPPEHAVALPLPAARVEEVPDESLVANKNVSAALPPVRATAPSANMPSATVPAPSAIPEHPFRDVRDAIYAPPVQRNFGLPPAATTKPAAAARKNDAAYKSLVPIYDPQHAAKVFRRCLEAPISITHEELLALAPEIRNATREACSTRRVPFEAKANDGEAATQSASRRADIFFADMPTSFSQAVADAQLQQSDALPPGAFVIADPLDCLLKTGQELPLLKASTHSLPVRTIEGMFQRGTTVSCILDSGSAIVSMSEGLCHTLGLAFDPSVILNMQSANGDFNPSLGLARNVPVRFGSVIVYLQFHIIRSPAYDVLLGRPFDVLTESIVQNFDDGSQTITLHDPNSNILAKVPTLPRRPPEFAKPMQPKSEPDFRDART
ncbi:hypothetical protein VTO73DRAFT_2493 [Trametes versicolor]